MAGKRRSRPDARRDSIRCRLCGKPFRAISWSHLLRRHGFDPEHPIEKYKARFRLRWAHSGLTRHLVRRAVIDVLKRRGRYWTRRRVVDTLRTLAQRFRPLTAKRLPRGYRGLPSAVAREFGSWRTAVRAVGGQLADLGNPKWTRDTLLARLRRIARRLGRPLAQSRLPRPYKGLRSAAERLFGSWHEALRAAQLPIPSATGPRKWSREAILARLRRLVRRSRPLRLKDLPPSYGGLVLAARREFGSWRRAVVAAGGRPTPDRRPWTHENILRELGKFGRQMKPLASNRLPAGYGGLRSAAIATFGSWRNAVLAAGATPNPARRKWGRTTVLDELRKLARRIRPLTVRRLPKGHMGLYEAARRHYGSWPNAVRAAGGRPGRRPTSWSRRTLIAAIRRLGRDIQPLTVKTLPPGATGIYPAARKLFGSWEAALRRAGVRGG